MKATWALRLVVAAAVVGLAPTAWARDVWTDPYPGVRHLHRVSGNIDVHAVVVDLASSEISLVATRPRDRAMPVREFAHRYGADVAINANYFDGGAKSCGLAAGDGVVWADSYHDGCTMSLGFGPLNQALAFDSSQVLRGPLPEPWMTDVITGKPWLVRDGVVQSGWYEPRHIEGHHPRTAVGISRDRRTLYLVVADGRRAGIPGITGHRLAALMAELGAHDALNLDGGGSSEMFIRAENGVVNQPSDGRPRPVGNHLGIRVRPRAQVAGNDPGGALASAAPEPGAAPGPSELPRFAAGLLDRRPSASLRGGDGAAVSASGRAAAHQPSIAAVTTAGFGGRGGGGFTWLSVMALAGAGIAVTVRRKRT